MKDYTTAAGVVGALACVYFVAVYHWVSRGAWRRTPAGRHLMAFTANLGVLLGLIVLARVWPDYPGRAVVIAAFFTGLVLQVVWRCVLLHRAQHGPPR